MNRIAAALLGLTLIGPTLIGPTVALAGPVAARQAEPTPAAETAGQQFFVLSFTDAPIAEVAEAVIGGGLARSVSVDPAVEGTMSFRAEGWFTPDALLQDYGSALLDQEVALVRSRAGDLAIVPRAEMAVELASGASLIALPQPAASAPPAAATAAAIPVVYGRDRWWDGPLGGLSLFLIGALSGAAALLAGQTLAARDRRPPPATALRIAHATPPVADEERMVEDDGLVIPRFDRAHRAD